MTTSALNESANPSTVDGLRLGGGTFTRLPMTPPRVVNGATARVAMLSAPLWGLLVGSLAGGAAAALWWWFDRDGSPPQAAAGLCAVVAVAVSAWLSRGLHLDGLADTFDGFASMRHGPEALAIMRDPNAGALGVAALVISLLIQVSALAVVVSASTPLAVLAVLAGVGVVSRGVLAWVVRAGTPGADSGLGSVVVGSVPVGQSVLLLGGSGAITLLLLAWSGVGMIGAAGAVLAAILGALVLRRAACERFGAVTGDVLGAVVEVAATCAMLVVALAV